MYGKMPSKVKPLMSQDHFSADILFYLVERNSVKYNVSEVSESFSLWERKITHTHTHIYIYIYTYICV